VRQHISQMGVLNDYVKHLPTLKDSSKAVPTTKRGNIPFGKADLAAIVLSSVLIVAEPVQPQQLNGSQVHAYFVTRPRGHRASHG
jgi:hypothetical protein